jgi:hypothetical protein
MAAPKKKIGNLTLAQATKALANAEKAKKQAEQAATAAVEMVAKVRSAESRDKIMKLLDQIEAYCPEINDFDKDLQKEVKAKIRKIVKTSFGERFRITRIAKKGNKTTINYIDAEVIAILKKKGAINESTGLRRKEIQRIVSMNTINKYDGVFNDNAWSNRDKKKIKDSGNNKNMLYWVNAK